MSISSSSRAAVSSSLSRVSNLAQRNVNAMLNPAKRVAKASPYLYPTINPAKPKAALKKTLDAWKRLFPQNTQIDPITFTTEDDIQIRGLWIPAGNSTHGNANKVAIMAPGAANTIGSLLTLARELHGDHVNVLVFDPRSHGLSDRETSTTFGYKEGNEFFSALNFVQAQHPDQSQHVTFIGQSMSAAALLNMPASLSAQNLKTLATKDIRFWVDAAYARLNFANNPFLLRLKNDEHDVMFWDKTVRILNKFGARFARSNSTALVDAIAQKLNSTEVTQQLDLPYFLDTIRPADNFTRSEALLNKPVTIVHGRNDRRTAFSQGVEIRDALNQARATKGNAEEVGFLPLDADHMNYHWHPKHAHQKVLRSLTPNKFSVLRDDPQYLAGLRQFMDLSPKSDDAR